MRKVPLSVRPNFEEREAGVLASIRATVVRPSFVIGFIGVFVAATAAWPYIPRRYEAPATVVLLMDGEDAIGPSRQRSFADDNVVQSEVDRLASPALSSRVVSDLKLVNDPEFVGMSPLRAKLSELFPALRPLVSVEAVTRRLEARLSIQRDRRSYTVKFGYWAYDPIKAAALTKALLAAFVAQREDRQQDLISQRQTYVAGRVAALRARADASRAAVQTYADASGLIDAGLQTMMESELTILSTALANAKSQRIEASEKSSMLSSMEAAGTLQNAPEIIGSATIQRLKETLATNADQPGAFAPQEKATLARIAAESKRLVAAAGIDAAEATRREADLNAQIASLRRSLVDRARARSHLDGLQREADSDRTVLAEWELRARAPAAAAVSEIDILGLPQPPLQPISPDPKLAVLGTLLCAILVGTMLAWRRGRRPVDLTVRGGAPAELAA